MKVGDKVNSRGGFTIIEVTLVLAIAGLIFMMVFIALPALNRSQRDTRRRDDVLALLSNIKKYQTNNRGALPSEGTSARQGANGGVTSWQGFYNDYLGDNFTDPSGGNYRLSIVECGGTSVGGPCDTKALSKFSDIYDSGFPYKDNSIVIVKQASCEGEQVRATSNPRKVAALYRLEGAGVYCANT